MFNAGTLFLFTFLSLSGQPGDGNIYVRSLNSENARLDSILSVLNSTPPDVTHKIDTVSTNLITFAQSLKGIPYRYACADPKKGFDCSGFVMYVFNHFQMKVPRSSIDFTHAGKEIDIKDAMPGDIILFTGTDSSIRKVGHVGIITSVADTLVFIHASSGKTPAVIETALNPHYKKRFIKVIRVM
jgi:cell wall-associated NlpC family hydrolase